MDHHVHPADPVPRVSSRWDRFKDHCVTALLIWAVTMKLGLLVFMLGLIGYALWKIQ